MGSRANPHCDYCSGLNKQDEWEMDTRNALEELVRQKSSEVSTSVVGRSVPPDFKGLFQAMENIGEDMSDEDIEEMLHTNDLDGIFKVVELREALLKAGADFIDQLRAARAFVELCSFCCFVCAVEASCVCMSRELGYWSILSCCCNCLVRASFQKMG